MLHFARVCSPVLGLQVPAGYPCKALLPATLAMHTSCAVQKGCFSSWAGVCTNHRFITVGHGSAKLGLHVCITTFISQAAAAVCFLMTHFVKLCQECQLRAGCRLGLMLRLLLQTTCRLSPGGRTLQGCTCWPLSQAVQVLPLTPAILQAGFTSVQTEWPRQHLGQGCCRFAETISPCCHYNQESVGFIPFISASAH